MGTKKRRPRDLNQLAAAIVGEAVGDLPEVVEDEPAKDPRAVERGRLGGIKGGVARAKRLTPEQRSDIARKAVQTRWQKAE